MKNYKIMMLMALSLSFAVQASWHRPVAVSADEGRIDQEQIARANQMLLRAVTVRQVQDALAAGADVNARDNNIKGRTALMRAAWYGYENVVRMLLDVGADVHARDNDGSTAFKCAVLFGPENVVRMLLAAGADVHARNYFGQTALIVAAEGGRENVVRLLLDAGADVNAQDNDGETVLMYAAFQEYENMISMLLAAGADVNARINGDRAALMDAVLHRHENAVRMLLGWNDQMDVLLARDDISDEAKSRLVPLEPQAVQDTLGWIQTARQDQANLIHNRAIAVHPEIMQMLQDYLDAHPVSDYLLK